MFHAQRAGTQPRGIVILMFLIPQVSPLPLNIVYIQ